MRSQPARLLVRSQGLTPLSSLSAAGNSFRLDKSPHPSQWLALQANGQATAAELWDAAYDYAAQSGAQVEPDCENVWVLPATKTQRGLFAGGPANDRGIVNLQSPDFPLGPGFAWHLGDNYSQLRKAQQAITSPQAVRAAILDVGFDFDHAAKPAHLRLDLQRNFTGDGSPTAADPDRGGFLQNPGHGTATLALLAGQRLQNMIAPTPNGDFLGGAPGIEIIPLRIATSVVLFRTSAFADAINYLVDLQLKQGIATDVVSMSMGGVASAAWADAVNRAYDAGILLVTAAGNNYGRPKSIIFPARFQRVIAACGIMADFQPYDLPLGKMSGSYGPDGKMNTAMAAFTPNMPWAEIGSSNIVDWDGEGTSAATPQVAAAAALWLQQHKADLDGWAGWQKVEMVRAALFNQADQSFPDARKYFGRGVLRAFDSLSVHPTPHARDTLHQTTIDSAAFSFLRVLRGTIFTATADQHASALDESFNLELTQLMHREPNCELVLPDPSILTDRQQLDRFVDVVIHSPFASRRLKTALQSTAPPSGRSGAMPTRPSAQGGKKEFAPNIPAERRLRVFAFDPAAGQSAETARIAVTTVSIPWEKLEPGPTGEYIEVVDHDPASGCFYAPVDLDDYRLLSTDGLAPAEGDPKFHQQMVYAVAMRTIRTFECALGRLALWSPVVDGKREIEYVPRLRIYPHALRARNAYYNPVKKALLFGYFPARPLSLGTMDPGSIVFTCLSHDVVAHETAHALLDGMARGLTCPTNPDMLAFHEAFADIVALFQHFSLPQILNHELGKTRGDLRKKNYLVELAQEFGLGTGLHGALRSYIGTVPDPDAFATTLEPHDRGAILVAAIFDAFVTIYEQRIADLRRIASGGSGVLLQGDLHPDLVNRFAAEAATSASDVLRMCIRAVDYCPPVDPTFGDFLRALITVDSDLYPDDEHGYRPALIGAFRQRGIYPRDVRAMSQDPLRWRPPNDDVIKPLQKSPSGVKLFARLRSLGDIVRRISREQGEVAWPVEDRKTLAAWAPRPRPRRGNKPNARAIRPAASLSPREASYQLLRLERILIHDLIEDALEELTPDERISLLREFGVFDPSSLSQTFQVNALNFANHQDASGSVRRDVILWIQHERQSDRNEGGCTLIANCDTGQIRYLVRKSLASQTRQREIEQFRAMGQNMGSTYLGNTPFAGPGSRFAVMHDDTVTSSEEEGYA